MKICNRCKQEKDYSCFHKASRRKDGYNTWCKDCSLADSRDRYAKDKEKRRDQIRQWTRRKKDDPEYLFKHRLHRNIGNRIEANIYDLYVMFKQSPYCLYCNHKLTESDFSVDHLTPLTRGGSKTIENLAFTCLDCNYLKHTRTKDEFISFLKEYVSRFNSVHRD